MRTIHLFLLIILALILIINLYRLDYRSETSSKFLFPELYMPLIVSLSTSPKRLKNIKGRLEDLFTNQTLKPDFVYLNLPFRFERTDELYNEKEINDLKATFGDRLKVLRVNEDLGPVTKILPSILEEKKKGRRALIISIDDDIQYPAFLFEKLVARYKDKTEVISNSVYKMNDGLNTLEGYSGVLYDTDSFDDDIWSYVQLANQDAQCFRGDDYVLSRYLKIKGIEIKPLAEKMYPVIPLDYGLQADALHKIDQSESPNDRYATCQQYMNMIMH